MTNTQLAAPTFGADIVYDAVITKTLRGLIVNAAGGLVVTDITDVSRLITIPAGALPYKLDLQIRKVVGNGSGSAGNGTTGTDIAVANLVPLI